MGLTICKDAIFRKEQDNSNESGFSWKSWDAIKGADGKNTYYTWLEQKGYTETTEYQYWDEFLADIRAYGGIIGASRIVEAGDEYHVYTPTQTGSTTEPPDSGATFSGYTTFAIPTVGVTQHLVTADNTISPIYTSSATTVDGQLLTNIDLQGSVGIKNAEVVAGNRGDEDIPIVTSHIPQYSFKHLFSTAFSTNTNSVNNPGASQIKVKDVYGAATEIQGVTLSEKGDIYLGGNASTSGYNLGQTYLVAGAVSWSGQEYNMKTGQSSAAKYNAILSKRKVGTNKTWSGAWTTFTIPDSGHFEIFHFRIDINSKQAGKIYQYKIKLKNTYKEIPAVFWNWNQWNAVGSKLRSPDNYYDVWTRWDVNDKDYLFISVHCKEAAKINVNTALEPYLTFLVVTEDGAEIDWYNNVTVPTPNIYNAN